MSHAMPSPTDDRVLHHAIADDVLGGDGSDLLSACVHVDPPPTLSERLAALNEWEWLALAGRAQRHGVLPLVGVTLERWKHRLTVPARVRRAIELACRLGRKCTDERFRDLEIVIDALKGADVDVVGLKGIYLASAVYEPRALRGMGDLDLLVRMPDLAACEAALLGLGYERETSATAEAICRHHLPEFRKPYASKIEVHWSINTFGMPWDPVPERPVFQIDMDELWSRVEPVEVEGVRLLRLAHDDCLLHLCLHTGYNHAFSGSMRHVCDIDRYVRRHASDLDWSRLTETARRWNASKIVHVAIRLARETLGTPAPSYMIPDTGWTKSDEAAFVVIRTHMLRRPRRGTLEYSKRAPLVDAWLLDVTGSPGRASWRDDFERYVSERAATDRSAEIA